MFARKSVVFLFEKNLNVFGNHFMSQCASWVSLRKLNQSFFFRWRQQTTPSLYVGLLLVVTKEGILEVNHHAPNFACSCCSCYLLATSRICKILLSSTKTPGSTSKSQYSDSPLQSTRQQNIGRYNSVNGDIQLLVHDKLQQWRWWL